MSETDCSPLPAAVKEEKGKATAKEKGEAKAATAVDDAVRERPEARLRAIVEQHYDFVWRALRVVGLTDASAEDAAQQVMCVAARRLEEIRAGAERSFLFSTAMRVAAEFRRTARRRPATTDADVEALVAETPSSEELVDERRAHETLQRVLDAMPVELRLVFVLFEIEELKATEIAEMLGVPVGTVSSRLRRGREAFQAIVRRMQAAQQRGRRGGAP